MPVEEDENFEDAQEETEVVDDAGEIESKQVTKESCWQRQMLRLRWYRDTA
jgi:hypothetical protein